MKYNESKLQQSCVKWFRLQYPNELLFSVPNGGKRNVITASIMKAEGALSGVPDIFLAHSSLSNDGWFHGLFIEMKFGNGKMTDNQKIICDKLLAKGYAVKQCNSFDEFVNIIQNYLKK